MLCCHCTMCHYVLYPTIQFQKRWGYLFHLSIIYPGYLSVFCQGVLVMVAAGKKKNKNKKVNCDLQFWKAVRPKVTSSILLTLIVAHTEHLGQIPE